MDIDELFIYVSILSPFLTFSLGLHSHFFFCCIHAYCIHVCTLIHIYVYIFWICTYTYICIYIYICIHIYICIFIYKCVCLYVCIHVYTYIFTYAYSFIHTHRYMCVCIKIKHMNESFTFVRPLSQKREGSYERCFLTFSVCLLLPSFSVSLCLCPYCPKNTSTSQNDINTGYKQLACALCAQSMARETQAPRAAWVRVAESTCVTFGPQCAQLQRAYLVTLAGRV